MGELVSPMKPHAAQNEAASSPSDTDSLGSSVFESDDNHNEEKQVQKPSEANGHSIHLPIIEEVTC